jgi:hypothetical protein
MELNIMKRSISLIWEDSVVKMHKIIVFIVFHFDLFSLLFNSLLSILKNNNNLVGNLFKVPIIVETDESFVY